MYSRWPPRRPDPRAPSIFTRPAVVRGLRLCSQPLEPIIETIAHNEGRTQGYTVGWISDGRPRSARSPHLSSPASRRSMPAGAREGRNDSGDVGYSGPYPPKGRHRYFFKLYALDSLLGPSAGETKSDLLRAMDDHVLGMTELMGTYERQ